MKVFVVLSNVAGELDRQEVTEGRAVGEVIIKMVNETGTFNFSPDDKIEVVEEEDDED